LLPRPPTLVRRSTAAVKRPADGEDHDEEDDGHQVDDRDGARRQVETAGQDEEAEDHAVEHDGDPEGPAVGPGGQRDDGPQHVPGVDDGEEDDEEEHRHAQAADRVDAAAEGRPEHADDPEGTDEDADGTCGGQRGVPVVAEAEGLGQPVGEQSEVGGRRHPADDLGGAALDEDPAETEAGDQAECRHGHRGGRHVECGGDDEVAQPAAEEPGECDPGEPQGEEGGDLDQSRTADQGDAGGAEPPAGPARPAGVGGAQGEFEAGEQEAEHDGLVVDAGDEVEQDQGVEDAEPQCGGGVDAAPAGETGQGPGGEGDAGDGEEPVEDHRRPDRVPGEVGDDGGEADGDGSVGGGGVRPHVGHRPGERVVGAEEVDGAGGVGVHAAGGDGALGEVGVDVLGEHRGGEQQRDDPRDGGALDGAQRQAAAAGASGPVAAGGAVPPEHHPGQAEQGDADEHGHGGGVQQPGEESGDGELPQGVLDDGDGAGADPADADEDAAECAGEDGGGEQVVVADPVARQVRGSGRCRPGDGGCGVVGVVAVVEQCGAGSGGAQVRQDGAQAAAGLPGGVGLGVRLLRGHTGIVAARW
jgi:hypothetical protein